MGLDDLLAGRWPQAAATEDPDEWRRVVWTDFLGALALCAMLAALLAVASRCT
jgi:hypothetical protein